MTSSLSFGRIKNEKEELQFMPPYFKETIFPVDVIVELMDFSGVEKAVLLQNPVIGTVNDEIAEAITKYPTRFAGTIQVDPLDPAATDTIKKYSTNPKHTILKFEMSDGWGWSGIHKGLTLEDDSFTPIWDIASKKRLQVIIDPGRPNNAGYQVEAIDRVTTNYPDTIFIIEHLGGMNKENIHNKKRWLEMIKLGTKKNVFMGLTSIGAGLREDFPCKMALELLKEAYEIMGADKLLWGSDLPSNLKFYTYKEMADMVLSYADFLSGEEKELIMRGNALKIFTGLQ
jgi:predicted TIM-barrel fold metal-dependent hydrolase